MNFLWKVVKLCGGSGGLELMLLVPHSDPPLTASTPFPIVELTDDNSQLSPLLEICQMKILCQGGPVAHIYQ